MKQANVTNAEIGFVSRSYNDLKTIEAARASLSGKQKGILASLLFIGPAFIASIAYIDPGNFATNIQSGSQFGFGFVVLLPCCPPS